MSLRLLQFIEKFLTLIITFLVFLILLCMSACSENIDLSILDSIDDVETLSPDEIESLTKRGLLTHSIYTSEKLMKAVDNGRFGHSKIAHSSRRIRKFEPTLWGNSSIASRSSYFNISFIIVVKDIEYKNSCAWRDEFYNLHRNYSDNPHFTKPVGGQVIDTTTNTIVSSLKFWQWATSTLSFDEEGNAVYVNFKDENGVQLPREEMCKIDNSEVVHVGEGFTTVPNLTPESWEDRFELISDLTEKLIIRIHLEDNSFFDYDFKELFPNPVIIGVSGKLRFLHSSANTRDYKSCVFAFYRALRFP